ncbi:TetR/AcrR family transcriptional regulator [Acinetobacter haemolyticus]|uniref:TetR/AcrR family transcriptional regulator n=1 Tax=Acinetobacter haemolyticus TaxID=29430 RepID=UPI000F75A334|nr:TetR/AcrR family transcriptional regulator [Acinetobacter haemolyticus]AZN69408.1 TetR/AcrR family transcriptional regulator [Acinetobacter haemolyticus]MCU4378527.1 TetR/AcrR family transcriptional regulator [Acinetobacter haemolyticus]MCU4386694.1 TetR/AcrR family transcriptional regulator [Acinetobacter haemolyticus]WPO66274.1 TetR/AcrR family transcriptional regulator [Acinetobacter haemolyticus]
MVEKRLTKEQRRQQLLQVARLIIRTEGVEALTLGYLAQQAGITKPIAYRHFIDKEGLLIAIYKEFSDKQKQDLSDALAQHAKSLEQIIHFFCSACLKFHIATGPEVGLVVAALSGTDILQNYLVQCQQEFIEIFKQGILPFVFLEGQEGEAIIIAITGLMETICVAASNGVIDAEIAQRVMGKSTLLILNDYLNTRQK